jgi:hypothetical protein
VAYSDASSPHWVRISGLVVWIILGFALLEPLSDFLIADCISIECSPSLGWRLFALVLLAFSASAAAGWAVTALLHRLTDGRAE